MNKVQSHSQKKHFGVMTFQVSSSNGSGLWLIAIAGVLFLLLKDRAQEKKLRPAPDRTSGLIYDTILHPHEYDTSLEISEKWLKRTKKRVKQKLSDQPA
jgi:hypothetical protein